MFYLCLEIFVRNFLVKEKIKEMELVDESRERIHALEKRIKELEKEIKELHEEKIKKPKVYLSMEEYARVM